MGEKTEPGTRPFLIKRFFQNLFHAVREAFGYTYPNYDVGALAKKYARCAAGASARCVSIREFPIRTRILDGMASVKKGLVGPDGKPVKANGKKGGKKGKGGSGNMEMF